MGIYNETDSCDRCRKDLLLDRSPRREYDINKNWIGKWDCHNCWQKFDPNSHSNIIKSLRKRRNRNENQDPRHILGDNCEELTCIWRGVDNLNIKNDNYKSPIDHSRDSELGVIDTRGKLYDPINQWWSLTRLNRYHNKEIDHIICYCLSKDGNIIERIYTFPILEIIKRSGITIVKYNSIGQLYKYGWYEKYRIKDEGILKKVNEIWKGIIERSQLWNS